MWAAARLVLLRVWPLPVLALVALGVSAVVAARTGGLHLLQASWWFTELAVLGLIGSFALHETAHLLALRRTAGVHHIHVTATRWRVSIAPVGTMTPRQVLVTALVGPASAVVVGLLLLPLNDAVAVIYLAHGLQLLPMFGDGRAVVHALRGRGLSQAGTVS